jgi:hypothetical protein
MEVENDDTEKISRRTGRGCRDLVGAPTRCLAQEDASTGTPRADGDDMMDTTPRTGYAPVDGLQMYYEIHGTGQPLVLLHGALGAIDL